jgi:hypothetical protein
MRPGMIFSFIRTRIAEIFFINADIKWREKIKAMKREFENKEDYEEYVTSEALRRFRWYKPMTGCPTCTFFWLSTISFATTVFLTGISILWFPVFFSASYFAFVLTYGK